MTSISPFSSQSSQFQLYVDTTHFSPSNTSRILKSILHNWEKEDTPTPENRTTVARQIQDYCDNPQEILSISDTTISSFPDIFSLEPFKSQLLILDLSTTSITSLPTSIKELESLESLNVTGTLIETLPESIASLKKLKMLLAAGSSLKSIPDYIEDLTYLELLLLDHSEQLTDLPLSVLNLNATVSVINCPKLSDEVFELITKAEVTESDSPTSYKGPHFKCDSEAKFNFLLKKIYTKAGIEVESLPNLSKQAPSSFINKFSMWLNRLQYTKDSFLQEHPDNALQINQAFYKIIVDTLRCANTNKKFKSKLSVIISDACFTCGDRVTLSILHLGIARKLVQADKTNLKSFFQLLKGIYIIEVLKMIAIDKIATLRIEREHRKQLAQQERKAFTEPPIDEVSVYLGYPLKVKHIFELPIDPSDMLFFNISNLTESDISKAIDFVKLNLAHQPQILKYLHSRDDWKLALKTTFPSEYQEAEDIKNKALEVENPDYMVIENTYHDALSALTLRALGDDFENPNKRERLEPPL